MLKAHVVVKTPPPFGDRGRGFEHQHFVKQHTSLRIWGSAPQPSCSDSREDAMAEALAANGHAPIRIRVACAHALYPRPRGSRPWRADAEAVAVARALEGRQVARLVALYTEALP
jgi:hypothetical protein